MLFNCSVNASLARSVSFFFSYSVTLYFNLKGRIKKNPASATRGGDFGFSKTQPEIPLLHLFHLLLIRRWRGSPGMGWTPPTGIMA